MTEGEYRVGITFNPSRDHMVGLIKRRAADLIDLIESIEIPLASDDSFGDVYLSSQVSEIQRLKSLAKTEIEAAAMWAVKAATKPSME
jgi:hypothetical protein